MKIIQCRLSVGILGVLSCCVDVVKYINDDFIDHQYLNLKLYYLGLTHLNVVRGASEARDQGVLLYSAGANERSNEEIRQMRKSYIF